MVPIIIPLPLPLLEVGDLVGDVVGSGKGMHWSKSGGRVGLVMLLLPLPLELFFFFFIMALFFILRPRVLNEEEEADCCRL